MIEIKVETEGQLIPLSLRNQIKRAMEKTVQLIKSNISKYLDTDKSNDFIQAVLETHISSDYLYATIGVPDDSEKDRIISYVEFGTGPMGMTNYKSYFPGEHRPIFSTQPIKPKTKQYMKFYSSKFGKTFYLKQMMGQRGQAFIRRGLYDSINGFYNIEKIWEEELAKPF